jgi:hypothetical protein
MVAASAKARPDWIKATATPGATSCTEDGGGVLCIGVSNLSPSQEDAEDEASDAAVEAVAFELGKRVTDKEWAASIPPIYLAARDTKLAAMNRDTNSSQARRDVRDGRRAVAHALRGVNPTARYWESFSGREGRKFLAFVQVKLSGDEAKKLIATYTDRQKALGATAVTFFPELAWKYPKLAKGAVITGLETGAVQALGVAQNYIVLAVDGRDTPDAASFAKIVSEEHTLLADRGGALRLLVQSDNGDPREFSTTLAGKPIQIVPDNSGKRHGNGNSGNSGGSINVWDRLGGGKGTGRDDPTQ